MAEMTGRRGRVVRTDKQQEPHYEARESDNSSVEGLNVQEVSEKREQGGGLCVCVQNICVLH